MISANTKELSEKVGRAVLMCLFIGLMTYAGYQAGSWIARSVTLNKDGLVEVHGKWIKWDLGTLAFSYLLLQIEKLLKLFKGVVDYVSAPATKVITLLPDFGALLAVSVSVSVVGTLALASPPNNALPQHDFAVLNTKPAYFMMVDRNPIIFPFPLYGPGAPDLPQEDPQLDELNRIVASLRSCVGKEPNDRVIVQVQGFADANEFKRTTDSDDRNRDLANSRAAILTKRLSDMVKHLKDPSIDLSKLTVQSAPPWKSFEEMKNSRRWLQVKSMSETGKEQDQGLFDRRAEIVLLRAGACQPSESVEAAPSSYAMSQK
jgi:hypothetical protein